MGITFVSGITFIGAIGALVATGVLTSAMVKLAISIVAVVFGILGTMCILVGRQKESLEKEKTRVIDLIKTAKGRFAQIDPKKYDAQKYDDGFKINLCC